MEDFLNEGSLKHLCYIICAVFIVVGGVLLILGFSTLQATEIGLDYSWVSKNVAPTVYENGLHFLGIGHSFVKYPKMVQTIEFSKEKGAEFVSIQSRTKDGLEVVIEISFQYQIQPEKLYTLFQDYGLNYHSIFQNIAVDSLTEESTYYTANDFFWKRAIIKDNYEKKLRKMFSVLCYSDVIFLQLRSVDLPNAFEDAIQETEVRKQDINIANAQKKKVTVEVETLVKSALYQKNVTINLAEGEAQAILQNNQATVDAYNQVQTSQTKAYSNLRFKLKLKSDDLLKMIKTQVIRDYNGNDLAISLASPEKSLNVTK